MRFLQVLLLLELQSDFLVMSHKGSLGEVMSNNKLVWSNYVVFILHFHLLQLIFELFQRDYLFREILLVELLQHLVGI